MSQAYAATLPLELRSLLASLSKAEVADDQRWIVGILRDHGPVVVRLLWRMLGSEPDVLDAFQTAVCQLTIRGREAIRSNPGGYFYRVGMNAGIAVLHRGQEQRRQWPKVVEIYGTRASATTDASACVDQQELLARLRQAVLKLPSYLRDVIVLRDLAELPYREVARTLSIKEGTARLYRHQAVERLADLMRKENLS